MCVYAVWHISQPLWCHFPNVYVHTAVVYVCVREKSSFLSIPSFHSMGKGCQQFPSVNSWEMGFFFAVSCNLLQLCVLIIACSWWYSLKKPKKRSVFISFIPCFKWISLFPLAQRWEPTMPFPAASFRAMEVGCCNSSWDQTACKKMSKTVDLFISLWAHGVGIMFKSINHLGWRGPHGPLQRNDHF